MALPIAFALLIQAAAAADRELGRYLSSECTACHQAGGDRQGGIPAIVGLPPDQFIALMDAYGRKQRENPVMQAVAGRLSRDEIEALAAYFGSLEAGN